MDSTLSLSRASDLTPEERDEIRDLTLAVYPPEEWADWPGWRLEWAVPEWCVRIRDERGALVSHTGIVLRQITLDDAPLRIGGVGSVKTHPAARGRGYARLGIERAVRFFDEQEDVAFALLVCEPHLLPYYSSLGWKEFHGRLLVTQRGEVADFTFNRIMTHDVRTDGPIAGTINLCGAPW